MSQVFNFTGYTPPARYDNLPWTEARIEESDAPNGSWTLIDTLTLTPVDADPAKPQSRNLTTHEASNTPLQWYRIVWADDAAHTSPPTSPIQDIGLTVQPFTTRDELFRILNIRNGGTDAQQAAADRVILVAANEIMAEIDLAQGELSQADQALCASVNLDRAADLWRHTESIPGVLGGLDDVVQTMPGRYSWERYAQRLAPVKQQWGLA